MIYLTTTSEGFETLTSRMLKSSGIKEWTLATTELNGDFGQSSFNELTCKRARLIRRLMTERKDDVFVCDGDVHWFTKASQLEIHAAADVQAQIDPDSGFCCGFMFLRNTEATKVLLDVWCSMMDGREGQTNDQMFFNSAFAHLKRIDMTPKAAEFKGAWSYGRVLSAEEKPLNIWEGQAFKMPEKADAFHANYCVGVENKIKLLDYVCKSH